MTKSDGAAAGARGLTTYKVPRRYLYTLGGLRGGISKDVHPLVYLKSDADVEISRLTEERDSARKGLFSHLTGEHRLAEPTYDQLVEEVARLKADSDILRKRNIIEIAVANDTGSVSEYMNHWEGRALKAEAEVERLTRALGQERKNTAALLIDVERTEALREQLEARLHAVEADRQRLGQLLEGVITGDGQQLENLELSDDELIALATDGDIPMEISVEHFKTLVQTARQLREPLADRAALLAQEK